MCPDWESNRQPFGLQAGTQSTKPHQPAYIIIYLITLSILKLINSMMICSMPVFPAGLSTLGRELRWDCFGPLEVREKGPWRQVLGISPGGAAAAHCSPCCKSCGDPKSSGDEHPPEREERREHAPRRESANNSYFMFLFCCQSHSTSIYGDLILVY